MVKSLNKYFEVSQFDSDMAYLAPKVYWSLRQGKYKNQIAELNDKLKTPEEVLEWGLENVHPKLELASSFGA